MKRSVWQTGDIERVRIVGPSRTTSCQRHIERRQRSSPRRRPCRFWPSWSSAGHVRTHRDAERRQRLAHHLKDGVVFRSSRSPVRGAWEPKSRLAPFAWGELRLILSPTRGLRSELYVDFGAFCSRAATAWLAAAMAPITITPATAPPGLLCETANRRSRGPKPRPPAEVGGPRPNAETGIGAEQTPLPPWPDPLVSTLRSLTFRRGSVLDAG